MRNPARWIEIAVGIVVFALLATGLVSLQSAYERDRVTAVSLANTTYAQVDTLLADASPQLAALEIAIENGQKELAASAGRTLTESPRSNMKALLDYAGAALETQKKLSTQLSAHLTAARHHLADQGRSADELRADVALIAGRELPSASSMMSLIESIGHRIRELQDAQTQWQAEQERIAAEKAAAEAAARMARARTISSAGSLTESGGSTAPSAPSPPPSVVTSTLPAVISVSVEDYVAALAPNSYISWVVNLCNGYYACGRTWVGGSNTTPTRIELDPALLDIYANRIGVSVLVHEAAHARQWWTYGSNIIAANEAFTAAQGITGRAAVEYMADCATIGKLGYSTGAYTSTCTPEQIAGIAVIW